MDPSGTRIAYFDEAETVGTERRNEIKVVDAATGAIATIVSLPASSKSHVLIEARAPSGVGAGPGT